MDSNIVGLMIGISSFIGALGLGGLIWAIKTGQFDDRDRFLRGAHDDGVEDLNDAAYMQRKKEKARKKEKGYRPPD
jgi:cbb3-type cytochrome oxidase maturation protein